MAAQLTSGQLAITNVATPLSDLIDIGADRTVEYVVLTKEASTSGEVAIGDANVELASPATDPPVNGTRLPDDTQVIRSIATLDNLYLVGEISVPPTPVQCEVYH